MSNDYNTKSKDHEQWDPCSEAGCTYHESVCEIKTPGYCPLRKQRLEEENGRFKKR